MKIESDPSFPVSTDAILRVEGKEKVFDFLGHWPSFADMEVIRLHFDRLERRPSIHNDLVAEFYIYDLSKAPGDKERRQGYLEILFSGLRDLKIEGWNDQNQIQGLSIIEEEAKRFSVYWGGGLGHEVSFSCERISVLRIRDRNPFRESQEW